MKKTFFICAAIFAFVLGTAAVRAEEKGLILNQPLPKFELPVPGDAFGRNYLDLDRENGMFKIGELRAELVIIEIFSMYCPFCQREAPKVNALFNLIQADKQLSPRIKMIGIGVGNSGFEVDYFRKSYKIEFPLFPDEDFKIHKLCGEVRTPYFIGVKNTPGQKPIVIYTHLGGFESPRGFLDEMLKRGGLEK
ncbi:MAG: redoxin domain-containing protein [Desulfosarcinaceae bacterium]